mgnify:CR=1 FL=1
MSTDYADYSVSVAPSRQSPPLTSIMSHMASRAPLFVSRDPGTRAGICPCPSCTAHVYGSRDAELFMGWCSERKAKAQSSKLMPKLRPKTGAKAKLT